MSPFLVITGGDARFFNLAQGCIQSLRDKPEGSNCDIAFLDLGCSPEQQIWLQSHVNVVRQVDWEFTYPSRDRTPPYLRIQQARPFLRRYFPGYEVYLWLDADTWVQDWTAVRLFIEGAIRRRGLAIVPELDRGSQVQYGGLPQHWQQIERWYSTTFGEHVGKRLCSFPMLNAGIFALHADAPHWTAWEDGLRAALYRDSTFMIDQIVLNFLVYARGLLDQTELLPAWCNWTCHLGMPRWDESRSLLVEPYLPHTSIGILHLTAEKHRERRLLTTSDKAVDIRLRYPPAVVQGSVTENLPTAVTNHEPVRVSCDAPDTCNVPDEFLVLFESVRPFTLLEQSRLISLYALARHACQTDLPGHFVECGTWRGGAAALLASVIKRYSRRPRRVYCFDTFNGMPDPTDVDKHRGVPANQTGFGAGTLKAPVADYLDVICRRLEVQDFVVPVQGLFSETLAAKQTEIADIALLHADADWYNSTIDILTYLYGQVVHDGFIQFDDYGHWEGCKKAVHDFERKNGLSFCLHQIDYAGVWMKKD
jgi:hypothetical protein